MHRQPFSNAKHRDNAQLPETFPIIKNAAKDYNLLRKRKERPANHDLRVRCPRNVYRSLSHWTLRTLAALADERPAKELT